MANHKTRQYRYNTAKSEIGFLSITLFKNVTDARTSNTVSIIFIHTRYSIELPGLDEYLFP